MSYYYQGVHSGRRDRLNTRHGIVFRSRSTYAQTVEGSGFTCELSINDYFGYNWDKKLGYLADACENAPHQQRDHNVEAINFILSLKILPNNGSRSRVSNTHLNRLAKILDQVLQCRTSTDTHFRLWVSNSGYLRDDECDNNRATWITRKLAPYEWAEVICLEMDSSSEFNRPWLVTERLLGEKSSGYWTLDSSDEIKLTEPLPGTWWSKRRDVEKVRSFVQGQRNSRNERWFKDNCDDIVNRLKQLERNNEGALME